MHSRRSSGTPSRRAIAARQPQTPTYEFELTFGLADKTADPASLLDALYEAGCDDAAAGIGRAGMVALHFSRQAASAAAALRSAVQSVRRAIPRAPLIEAKPDLVNLSDIADLLGVSRQNIRKYAAGEIRSVRAAFPAPSFSGRPAPLWHLYEVAVWFDRNTALQPAKTIIDTALAAYRLNIDAEKRRIATLVTAGAA